MEKVINRLPLFRTINAFLNSQYFVAVSAIMALISSIFGLEMLEFSFVALSLVAICFLSKDSKPIIPLMLTVVFSISIQHTPAYYYAEADTAFFTTGYRPTMIIGIVIICFLAIVARLFIFKQAEAVFLRRRALTLGLIAFTIGLAFNGISTGFKLGDFAFGLLEGCAFLAVYSYFINTLGEKADYSYFCNVCVAVAILLFCQLVPTFLKSVSAEGMVQKQLLVWGWGLSNNIGGLFVLLIAPIAYMAYSSKAYPFYTLMMLLCVVGVVMSLSRSAMLAMIITLPIIIGILVAKGKNRIGNAIFLLLLSLFVIIFANVKYEKIMELFSYYSSRGLNDSGRLEIYKQGLNNFLARPIFGVGFSFEIQGCLQNNIMLNMYHNTIIQLFASCGIIGVCGYVWSRVESVRLFVSKFTCKKFFMILSIASILITGLLDNGYFYFYPMFFYMLQLVFAEREKVQERKGNPHYEIPKGTRPRILIPLVEAGMGHITSALAIADSMKKQFGDELEIVCVYFFRDSGSRILQKFEKKLVQFVISQNKIPGFGTASLMATDIFGRKVSLKYVMESHVPNAFEIAKDYIQSFNADMIISTHWSTSYYAWRLENRPIVVNYCPDAMFNLMFDTGEDLLLISTESGAEKARKDKFNYNCEIKTVPFCLRKEIYEVSKDVKYNRLKNGIDENAWTVVLADGGYGAGKLEYVVNALLKADLPITIIAVAGKNNKLYKRFLTKKVGYNTVFKPIGFSKNLPELISCANLFIGKSGAMTMAEPCYFGVPTIVSYCATPIETHIAEFYCNKVGSALRLQTVAEIVKAVKDFHANPQKLAVLHNNAESVHSMFDVNKTAKVLYDYFKEKTKEN